MQTRELIEALRELRDKIAFDELTGEELETVADLIEDIRQGLNQN